MATIEQFAIPQGWRITSWQLTPGPGIPPNPFVLYGTVLIGVAQDPIPACDLSWLNSAGEQCSITKVPFQEGKLLAGILPVTFGGLTVDCAVTLSFDVGVLSGLLASLGGDGNTGTFAADANPGG
jgi:hypothetical protein